MDPFILNLLVMVGTVAVGAVPIAWFLPKFDRMVDRLERRHAERRARIAEG